MPAINKLSISNDDEPIDFTDLENKYSISLNTSFDTVVCISNLPIIDSSKEEKLINVIKKAFKNMGTVKEGGVFMPKSTDGKSKGFLFMDFLTSEMATAVVKQGDGYKLDKSHNLSIFMFDDIEKYSNMNDTYIEPPSDEFVPKEHLKGWLSDERARDQFALLNGDQVGVYYNNKTEKSELVHSRNNWTDAYITWSPKGSYLTTVHKQGIALWGGSSWNKLSRFAHQNVKLFDFSPNEKYIVTWSYETFSTLDGEKHNICVWDVASGKLLRSFFVQPTSNSSEENVTATSKIDWPMLKWSFDGKYLAKMVKGADGMLQIYETPGMGLMGKKSIKIENLMDFSWSPKEHSISYWTPENGNIPARVTLLSVPSREILRTKNLFGVISCKMFWQDNGDYLLVKVERIKSKKQTMTSFEFFRIREKSIPVDVFETNSSDEVTQIFWEPSGKRFVLLSEAPGQKISASFYQISEEALGKKPVSADSASGIKLIKTIDAKGINHVSWSPKGRFCVLVGLRGYQGTLMFWDAEDSVMMANEEHYSCTEIEWDPTGRYVTTSVSGWNVQTDTGFMMWTLTGALLTRQMITGFKQFLWRPRPETLLSENEQKAIRKKLKEYSKDFEMDDLAESSRASREVVERRESQWKEWKMFVSQNENAYSNSLKNRIELYGFDPQAALKPSEDWVEV